MPPDDRDKLLNAFMEQRDGLQRFLRRRTTSPALAEDIAQETWLRAASAPLAATILDPRRYLFRIAANLLRDLVRHRCHAVEVMAPAAVVESIPDTRPDPELEALRRADLADLLRAVEALPPRCRQVFLLVKVEGLSYAEAAAQLGIARNTVMVHMSQALKWLDGYLAARNGEAG